MTEESSINNIAISKINDEEDKKEEERMKETIPKKLLKINRFFTKKDVHPFDELEWITTRVKIKNMENKIMFDYDVEHPMKWNEMAVRTCADKYFKTNDLENHPHGGERSVKDVIHRVAFSISKRGVEMQYFDEENGKILYNEICYLIVNQIGAFNSPVFFNWGLYDCYNFKGNSNSEQWAIKDRDQEVFRQEFEYENARGSACYITDVEDELINGKNGIYDWIQTEMSIFASGSGSGVNVSKIRGEDESMTGGGKSSGLISFLEVADASAGAVKSGGKCLAPDQYVYTEKGPIKAKDLDGKEFICISYDPPSNRYKAKKAHCWKSGTKQIVEIITDKGKFYLSTDHPVRLSSDEVIEAGKLQSGMSIFNCIIDRFSGLSRIHLKNEENEKISISDLIKRDITNYELIPSVSNKKSDIINVNQNHKIKEVNFKDESEVYSVEVDCPTVDDKTINSGHNFVIWPNKKHTGSGIVVFNTRRAAKMIILNDNHPDLLDFVNWKKNEEFKARALMLSGYKRNWSDKNGAYKAVKAQNGNNSIAITDNFMKAVINDENWDLKYVLTGKTKQTLKARDIFNQIIEATWECGDPGVFFIDTINNWHTIPNSGPIRSSNPCGEFISLDNSSCNLSSLNLVRFLNEDKTFAVDKFRASIEHFITAMEIIVGGSSYPSREIAEVTKDTRALGLGYCNMGGLIMMLRYPYDSDQARSIISTVTSLETSIAYAQSAKIASVVGPFNEYQKNKNEFLKIIRRHAELNNEIKPRIKFTKQVHQAAIEAWTEASTLIHKYGVRNSQAVVIAPTGCITGDTLILTNNGLLPISEIGDVNGNQWQDIDLNILQESNIESSDKFYINGLDKTFKLKTTRGHILTSTWKHQLRVISLDGEYIWKKSQDIKKGDLLVLGYGGHEDLLGNKTEVQLENYESLHSNSKKTMFPYSLDIQTAEMLGYYMGDGCADKEGGIKLIINEEDKDLHDYFNKWFKNIGLQLIIEESEGCIISHAYSVNLYRWFKLNNFLKNKGNYGEGAESAFIPLKILQSNSAVACAFLRGLFEADSCICVNAKGSYAVEFSTVSRLLSNQVHTLLESLNILCKTIEKDPKNSFGNRIKYVTRILNTENVRIFLEKIGFLSKRKNNLLESIKDKECSYKEKRGLKITHIGLIKNLYEYANARNDIPSLVKEDIRTRFLQKKFSLYWIKTLLEKYPCLNNSKIGLILQKGNIQLVPVESCKYNGLELTYDISVPSENTYRANGVISHNTVMFLMGTTNNGIEPAYSLCSYKLMSDGSVVELICEEAILALKDLGYNKEQISEISNYILSSGSIEGAPHVQFQHYPIFDTANVDGNGTRCINMMAHVNAIAAATPFISGGISKTINLPENCSKDDIWNCYVEGWKKGCKGLALYRSGSKWSQPLNSKNNNFKKETIQKEVIRTKQRLSESDFKKESPEYFWEFYRGLLTRKKASDRAPSERLNFNIGAESVWMNIVRFPDNGVSEVWLEVGKENPTVNGLADTIGRICSIAIQYGVPIEALCSTMGGLQFSPAGFLRKNDLGIRSAKSLSDLTSQVLSKLHSEYNGLDSDDVIPIWDSNVEIGEEPLLVSESDQAKSRGYSGIRCERCGSWRTKGTIKCGICLSCQTSYGTCG